MRWRLVFAKHITTPIGSKILEIPELTEVATELIKTTSDNNKVEYLWTLMTTAQKKLRMIGHQDGFLSNFN